MFAPSVYASRRARLRQLVSSGLILFPGNPEASMNYPANTYHYRQDSNFLYYFGLDHPDLAGVIDLDNGKDIIFGNDVDIDDIIWMGPQPSMNERAAKVGVDHTEPLSQLEPYIREALAKGRKVHIVKPYRYLVLVWLESLLGVHHSQVKDFISEELILGIVAMRSIKEEIEIRELEKAIGVAYIMHTTAMRMARPGTVEQEIAGAIEGIALSHGGPVSFPVILSVDGQTLHNHYHGNILTEGRMMVVDAGCETPLHYASDITRTVPVGGKFNPRQKDIYQIVLDANMAAIQATRPGIYNKKVHLLAAKTIVNGLKDIDLMKGDTDEAVAAGAHALFFPHGLGHMLGLDVHDMEGLGEKFVGYNDTIERSNQFGLAFLRMARKHEPGFVVTIEPGIYFIPALIDMWRKEGKNEAFINYDKVGTYKDFGGIRIEDDILVTPEGCRVLGKPIPKTITDIENLMSK
ncbi:MAG: aminopeptidase P family protein [Bacteroidales bacterium]|nr:aminopeptidase P family protein [Bacteroidales bacterium]